MKHRTQAFLAIVAASALVIGFAPAATAQDPPGVTLEAGRRAIDFGKTVLLSGEISPAAEGETVSIVDEEGRERASAVTNAQGRYKVRVSPRYTTRYQALWVAVPSEPVTVKVRPLVNLRLQALRLFGKARISGTVRPKQESGRVAVTLRRNGKSVWTRRVALRQGRRFGTSFTVGRAAAFGAVASYTDAAGARGDDRTRRLSPALPYLSQGARGVYVRLLEKRLCELRYHLMACNRSFDVDTGDALRAFNKVEGRDRLGTVDAGTWKALASARVARPRYRTRGFHIEIDQTRQVVLMVKDAKVTAVLHTSTGAGNATRDGTFHVFRKLAGYSPNRLYYPSYFDGLRAFHGWPEVPTYNASHGCARLPMWAAKWVYAKAVIGTRVHVYH